jgi:hypothetical protein
MLFAGDDDVNVDVGRVRAKAIEIVALGEGTPVNEFLGALVIAKAAVEQYMLVSTPVIIAVSDDNKTKE